MTFEEAVAYLNEKGIEFIQGHEYVGEPGMGRRSEDRNYIEKIKLPFTAEEWLDLMQTDGKFLGACCGTISAARDVLLAQLRGGGWISGSDLWEFIETISSHDGFEFMLPKDHEHYAAWREWQQEIDPQEDPIYRLWEVWDTVKEHVQIGLVTPDPPKEGSKLAEDPIHQAVTIVTNCANALWWATSCFMQSREDEPAWMQQQRQAARQLTIARLLPSLRTLLERIDKLDLGDFEGFAVCSKEDPSNILRNGLGQCLFHTKEEAQRMIDSWSKRDDENEEDFGRKYIREKTVIRPVSVSSATGLTFLGEQA